VTAILLPDTDGNPNTAADPAWTPLRITHPPTEYPSGHACFTAATVTALREFFGRDDLSFSAYSADSGTTRHYDSRSEAMAELVQARIWAGLHFAPPPRMARHSARPPGSRGRPGRRR
jgi:hypothetical protein